MSIIVISPIKLIAESLVFLLESYGYEAYTELKGTPALVLVDLIYTKAPYPQPHRVPTVALIDGDPNTLLDLGYIACIDAMQTSEALIHIIKTTLTKHTLS